MTVQDTHATSIKLLDAVKTVVPLIEERAELTESDGAADPEVMQQLVDADVALLMAPTEMGGMEAEPSLIIEVLQELSRADGSTGWSIMASLTGTGTMLAMIPEEGARIVAESDNALMAGHGAPTGVARKVEGGYEVEGKYSFASGSAYAGWFLSGYRLIGDDGDPVLNEAGQPRLVFGVVPRDGVEFLGGWDVLGLKATASVDYLVKKQVIADHFLNPNEQQVLRGGPLYTMGLKSLPGLGHASFALGVAQRSLDEFAIMASTMKRPPFGVLNKHATIQRDVAHWHAHYESARAFVHSAFNTLYDLARDEAPMPDALKANCRIAASNAVFMAADVTRSVYLASGSVGLRNGHIIQRCFRDAHAASQHLFTAEHTYVDAGRIYLGTPGLTPLHSEVMTYTFAPPLLD